MLKQAFVFKTTTHFHLCPPKPSHNPSFSSSHCENTLESVSRLFATVFAFFKHLKREMETFKQTKYFPALHIVKNFAKTIQKKNTAEWKIERCEKIEAGKKSLS